MLEKLPESVGRVLKGVRPGLDKIVAAKEEIADAPDTIRLESPAFADGEPMPARYTADGEKLSPPLRWSGAPEEASALLLIVEDADSPTPVPLMHAIAWDLSLADCVLPEGALKSEGAPGLGYPMGRNSFKKTEYLPPDPPPGHGAHRYVFQLYALDRPLDLADGVGKDDVVDGVKDAVIAKGLLIGTYERPGPQS
jgi:Raf kinase inhibitor-like YbhB/YbcL family protein